MTPSVVISADGVDVTNALMDRLIEVSVQDNAGMHNDRLSIVIDDRGGMLGGLSAMIGHIFGSGGFIKLPPNGTVYDVGMGYADALLQDMPAPVTHMGRFIQDEIEVEYASKGRQFTIGAHAYTMEGTFKQTRTKSYHEMSLGDIVNQCAKRNGLQAVIAPGFESIWVEHLDQTEESDASFLTRLYDLYGAVAKPMNGKLLFGPPDGIRQLQGDFTDQVTLTEGDCLNYKYLAHGRGKFKKVKAKFINEDKGTVPTVTSTGGDDSSTLPTLPKGSLNPPPTPEPQPGEDTSGETPGSPGSSQQGATYTHPTTFASKKSAQAAADAKKASFDKMQCTFHAETIGDPYIIAGGTVILVGFRPEIPTLWHITKVTHKYDNKGYTSSFDADTKFATASTPKGGGPPTNPPTKPPTGDGTTPPDGSTPPTEPLPQGDLSNDPAAEPNTATEPSQNPPTFTDDSTENAPVEPTPIPKKN